MHFDEVVKIRRSIRDFSSETVPDIIIEKVLSSALSSPSSSNTQPYKIAVAKGAICDEIRNELSQKYQKASNINGMKHPGKLLHALLGKVTGVLPDGDFKTDTNYPPELKKRAQECGVGLYDTLNINRKDYVARDRQMLRNFELFDAPVAIFVFVHAERGVFSALDAGMFMQSLMLAATAEGLGTCAQGSLATWASPVKKRFNVDKDYKLICGISMGYPSDHIVNGYRPDKVTVDDICFSNKA